MVEGEGEIRTNDLYGEGCLFRVDLMQEVKERVLSLETGFEGGNDLLNVWRVRPLRTKGRRHGAWSKWWFD